MDTTDEQTPMVLGMVRDHARRYMEAAYGDSVWFRAPESFNNMLERWIWAVASGVPDMAETSIRQIEEHVSARKHRQQ